MWERKRWCKKLKKKDKYLTNHISIVKNAELGIKKFVLELV